MHSCRALEIKMSILQANINGWLINQENELLVRAQLVKFLDICKLDGVWGTVWFFTVLPWKSGSYSSAERILSDLFPATPATCSTNEKTLYCCKSNKSHIWYSGAVPPALCSNHWVCKLNVQQLPLLDSGGRNPPMHLCDSPPLHSWLWKTSHRKHSKNVALFFPSSLQRKSWSLSSKCVVSTPACTQKQWTRPGSGHWGAAKSKAASCCWHQLLIWFVRGWAMWRWAGWEHKQREEITETKKSKKKQQTEMKVQQHEETNRVSVRITESLNVRIGPWISCCTKVLLENAKLCILKYYEDFKRIKYYLQQRSTVYNLIFPPFLFLLHPEKSPSGNHPPCCREVWRLVNFSDGRTLKAWFPLCVLPLSLYLCICGEWTGKPHEGKRGSCPWLCLEVKEKKLIYIEANETSHTMQKVRWRWMRRAPIVPALHSATMRAWVYITQHTS